MAEEFYDAEIYTLTDEEGVEADYKQIGVAEVGENVYYALVPLDEKGEEAGDEYIILRAETDENGLASFERIPYGRYTVVETRPLSGYLPAGTVAELTVDGQYVNPDAPLEIVNVPADTTDIQTGVDLPFTPLMWAGVGMTTSALALVGVYGYRRRKRR